MLHVFRFNFLFLYLFFVNSNKSNLKTKYIKQLNIENPNQ